MYRKVRSRRGGAALDLDSLMDILSCLVGVMLFLVIYTVLELGSAAYQAEVVVSRERVPGSERVVVVANDRMVRVLDVRGPLSELLSGFEIVQAYPEVPVFVEALERTPRDAHFTYGLRYEPRSTTELLGFLDLVITERPGLVGDSIHQLGPDSRYAEALRRLDPEQVWLAFAVDSQSGDIFRRAREMAIASGFATGFDQLSLEFPLEVPLSEDALDDMLSPISTLSKPLR
ncbi:MAG TPA: hypothetical protein VMM35_06650 [Longimicrobiales bacterium]|nr:hypothetical protein [Longimicrobiales bacterium]